MVLSSERKMKTQFHSKRRTSEVKMIAVMVRQKKDIIDRRASITFLIPEVEFGIILKS
jgi:hypothetical protein